MGNELYVKKVIERVMIIDDQPEVRESIAEKVEDANLKPVIQTESMSCLDNCIKIIQEEANAAIFDYHLSQRNYAPFNGIQAVKELYKLAIPVLLATSYFNADMSEIQLNRQHIPVIIKPNEISSDVIIQSFKLCQNEFSGIFSPERKPWRSLIRVEEVIDETIYVVISSWSASEKIRLPISLFPSEIQNERILGMRFFAYVNIGAEDYKDLYFKDSHFEIAEKPVGRYATFLHS